MISSISIHSLAQLNSAQYIFELLIALINLFKDTHSITSCFNCTWKRS